jgi:hypothetical protein
MGPDKYMIAAPKVMREFIRWAFENKYLDQERFDDFMEYLPKDKEKEVKRLQKLGKLLYKLHTPNPGAWRDPESNKIQSINTARRPSEIEEGYMVFNRKIDADMAEFEVDFCGKIGPVQLSEDICGLLKEGDICNLTIGKYQKIWQVLETGNVYPKGTM